MHLLSKISNIKFISEGEIKVKKKLITMALLITLSFSFNSSHILKKNEAVNQVNNTIYLSQDEVPDAWGIIFNPNEVKPFLIS